MLFGQYRDAGNLFIWEYNPSLKMTEEEQLAANKKAYAGFQVVLTKPTVALEMR